MNETMKTILTRRSIRAYQPEQISEEAMREIVTAGQYAPSAMGAQQWLLVAVRNREFMARFGEDCKTTLKREADPFYGAPAAVLVFGEAAGYEPIRDGSCAMATMGLAAASLGLGSCWINAGKEFFPTEKGKEYLKELNVPDGYVPVGTLILGYPAEDPQPAPRREGTVIFAD